MVSAHNGRVTVETQPAHLASLPGATKAPVALLNGDYSTIRVLGHMDGWCCRMKPWKLRKIINGNAVLKHQLRGRPIEVLDVIGRMGIDVKVL